MQSAKMVMMLRECFHSAAFLILTAAVEQMDLYFVEVFDLQEKVHSSDDVNMTACFSGLLKCIHISLTCIFSLCVSSTHRGCMERHREIKLRREEMRQDVLREMRRPFLCGVT